MLHKPEKRRGTLFVACGVMLAMLWTSHLIMAAWGVEIHRSEGNSMQPVLGDGAIYVVQKNAPEIRGGDMVTAKATVSGTICRMVKWVDKVDEDKQQVYLRGAEAMESWRGWVPTAAIEGKVVCILYRGRVRSLESFQRERQEESLKLPLPPTQKMERLRLSSVD